VGKEQVCCEASVLLREARLAANERSGTRGVMSRLPQLWGWYELSVNNLSGKRTNSWLIKLCYST
jgi:hypothetical protein